MHVRRFTTHVEVFAPAKINLFLEVLAKRADGYHEVETVLAGVSIFDTLVFRSQAAPDLALTCRSASGFSSRSEAQCRKPGAAHELLAGDVPCGPENLAFRAAALLRERSGTRLGAAMHLTKRIPAAAGLGGASSDAAAALVAANIAWGLHWPLPHLRELAAELGSDVPFFLDGGAAVCRGRGEDVEAIRGCRLNVVVVRPPEGLSTKRVYGRCSVNHRPRGASKLLEALSRGAASAVGSQLSNDLQSAAAQLSPWIETLRVEFENQNLLGHQMSGSGSSYVGLCRSRRHARRAAARLRARDRGAVFVGATAVV